MRSCICNAKFISFFNDSSFCFENPLNPVKSFNSFGFELNANCNMLKSFFRDSIGFTKYCSICFNWSSVNFFLNTTNVPVFTTVFAFGFNSLIHCSALSERWSYCAGSVSYAKYSFSCNAICSKIWSTVISQNTECFASSYVFSSIL